MSRNEDYHDSALCETIDDVLMFTFKFVKHFNSLSRTNPGGPEATLQPEEPTGLPGYQEALAELFQYLSRPEDLREDTWLGAHGNVREVKEIETLFRVLQYFDIQPDVAIARICANPYGYLTALKGVFDELRTDRPLTIEEDIIIAFKQHKVSWDAARQVLNLRNATIRKLWNKAVKLKMKRAFAEVMREREARAARREPRRYHQLSPGERTYIDYARMHGLTQKQIAHDLGRSPSTISHEVRRLDPGAYGPMADYTHSRAFDDYVRKRRNCGRKSKLGLRDNSGTLLTARIRKFILCEKLSPEQIVFGKFKKMENLDSYPSKSTIYNWINNGEIYDLSRENLRRKGKKRKKYHVTCEKYEKGTSILNRPEHINDRSEFGHFEADSVVSCRDGKGRVFTLVERKTRYFMGKVVVEGTADNFVKFVRQLINKYGNVIKSITVDNGSEFAGWEELESMGIKIYFARPYCSNDKGCIEHHNGLLREFFPKKTDFSKVHQKTLDMKCLRLINIRPRKVLGWQSPQELFKHELELARQAPAA